MLLSRSTVVVLAGLVLALTPSRALAGYSYGSGYVESHRHDWGHDGRCLLMHPEHKSSEVFFCQEGDVLHLWDLDDDGRSVGARWSTSNGHSGICRWSGGHGRAGDCNFDFPESVTVKVYAGTCNKTASVSCRAWSQYRNVTGPGSIRAG